MSGLTRETINREIKKLQKKGIIDVKNRNILIRDKNLLEDELELAL
jgi:CRP-like cAMP-binding protein